MKIQISLWVKTVLGFLVLEYFVGRCDVKSLLPEVLRIKELSSNDPNVFVIELEKQKIQKFGKKKKHNQPHVDTEAVNEPWIRSIEDTSNSDLSKAKKWLMKDPNVDDYLSYPYAIQFVTLSYLPIYEKYFTSEIVQSHFLSNLDLKQYDRFHSTSNASHAAVELKRSAGKTDKANDVNSDQSEKAENLEREDIHSMHEKRKRGSIKDKRIQSPDDHNNHESSESSVTNHEEWKNENYSSNSSWWDWRKWTKMMNMNGGVTVSLSELFQSVNFNNGGLWNNFKESLSFKDLRNLAVIELPERIQSLEELRNNDDGLLGLDLVRDELDLKSENEIGTSNEMKEIGKRGILSNRFLKSENMTRTMKNDFKKTKEFNSSMNLILSSIDDDETLEREIDQNVDITNAKYIATHRATIELNNVNDVQYLGTVGVGTPPQSLRLIFDSGSSDLWIAGPQCIKCNIPQRYNPTKSTTFAQQSSTPISVHYGRGVVEGSLVRDTVNIGTLVIPEQQFILVNNEESLDGAYFDGVLGLAFPSVSHGGNSVLERLVRLKKITSPTFAVVLASENDRGNSKIVIGDMRLKNHDLKTFWWIPISNPRWWMFSAEVIVLAGGQQFGRSVKINSGNKQKSGKSELFNILAILDTGTSFITIPESQYKPFINTLIPPQAKRFCWIDSVSHLIQCPCKATKFFNPVEFRFSISGFSLPIGLTTRRKSIMTTPKPLIFQSNAFVTKNPDNSIELSSIPSPTILPPGPTHAPFSKPDFSATRNRMSDICSVSIVPSPNTLPWILGDAFLRHVDAIFDATPTNPIVGLRMRNPTIPLMSQLYSIDSHVPIPNTTIPSNIDDDDIDDDVSTTESLEVLNKSIQNKLFIDDEVNQFRPNEENFQIANGILSDDVSVTILGWISFMFIIVGLIFLLWTFGYKRFCNRASRINHEESCNNSNLHQTIEFDYQQLQDGLPIAIITE